jgi:hypothetical protein
MASLGWRYTVDQFSAHKAMHPNAGTRDGSESSEADNPSVYFDGAGKVWAIHLYE